MTLTLARVRPRMRRRPKFGSLVAPLLGICVFVGLWESAVRIFDVKAFVLPGPVRILRELTNNRGFFFHQASVTFREALFGLSIAFALALAIAVPMSRRPFVERAIQPVATLIVVIPLVCYAPALVIWLGPGTRPIVAVTAIVSFVPILFSAVAGLRSTDHAAVDLLRSVGARHREVFWRLEFPSALPHVLAGLRSGVGLALIGAVLGEWFALVSEGLGVQIQRGAAQNAAPLVWACAFTLGIIGALALGIIGALERRFRPSSR